MTCTHWLWATRTNGYEWDRPCDINSVDNGKTPFDCPCDIHVQAEYIADAMVEINSGGISVPPQFMDATILATDSQVLEDCAHFRLTPAGYDVNAPSFFSPCYLPTVTLPVQVPLAGMLPISLDCVTVSPNPATNIVNINLNGLEGQITSVQMVEIATGIVVFEQANPTQAVVNVDVSNFENGSYNVQLFRNEEISSTLVQIID